jgi:dihydrolipoamide dehydrogenase
VGEALGRALEREGVEIRCGANTVAARRDGEAYVLALEGDDEVRGDRLLVATGRRPRTDGIGVETAGVQLGERGEVPVDGRLRAGDGLWAIGDVTGVWPLTYVGKYQARIAAANILGSAREANYDAVPRVVFTDPQVAAVGERDGTHTATVRMADVARMATYTRAYAEREDFVSLVSDGERLTGAYALGPDAGEWLQQATLAIRARLPLAVLRDTIQPFPTFSEVFVSALAQLGPTAPAGA